MIKAMRLVLALTLLLHLSGVPAVAASPCIGADGGRSECCMRHHTGTGAALAAFCGCQMTPDSGEPSSAVATVVRADEATGPVPVVGTVGTVPFDMLCRGRLVPVTAFDPDSSPPRLSGSGFRC